MNQNFYANKKIVRSPYRRYFVIAGTGVSVCAFFSKLIYDSVFGIPIDIEELKKTHRSRIRED